MRAGLALLLAAGCTLAPFEPEGKRCSRTATCPEPWVCATATGAELGYCVTGEATPLVLTPRDDVHLKSGAINNLAILTVEDDGAGRTSTSYLRFEVSGLADLPLGAELALTNTWDAKRSGTFRASLGSGAAWSESSVTPSTLPTVVQQLSTYSAGVPPLGVLTFDVSAAITADGAVTLVLDAAPGAEPLVLYSAESASPPQLTIRHAVRPAAE